MLNNLKQSLNTTVNTLLANKVRSFLTMFGIIVGVGAVIVIMAVGAGAQSLILNQVKSMGTDLIGVLPGKAEEDGPPASIMGIVITTLTYDDALELAKEKNVPNLSAVAAYSMSIGTASWGSNTYDTNLIGTTASYLNVEGGELIKGRFITKEEEKNLSRVVVLGSTVKEELFGESEAVGQRIKIKKHSFQVIGVMEERGTVMLQDYDDRIYIPLLTVQKLISGVDHIGFIRMKVDSEDNIDQAINDISMTLRDQHDIDDSTGSNDDFTVRSMAQGLDIISTITDAMRYFLAAMAALSLLVGGIGIMNIMLVSVTERTREIGLRKAIGAKNFDIMNQFLLEAVAVTAAGGIIGVIGGVLFSFVVSLGVRVLGYDWDFVVSPVSIILAVAVATLVGLVFGIYPARKASRLEPVEALRYE